MSSGFYVRWISFFFNQFKEKNGTEIFFQWRFNWFSTGKKKQIDVFVRISTNVNRTSKKGDCFLDKTFAAGGQIKGGSDHFAMYNVAN